MKSILLAVSATLLFIVGIASAQQAEETCKSQVDATISALDIRQQQTGQEQSLQGLTKKDIQELLKTKSAGNQRGRCFYACFVLDNRFLFP